ncbi:acyl-CoA N-acyltransferase [Calocera viscosa TUFC12733]|uniref:Acyl-CoA N-acyltransferase n=1 Tax=Calocera viscosa (strain TUFC12733) TaxID=1330018 RepID=A0A167KH25_CALVF|nr:acyl-CoA N-acyltransferase [Calocera viscosa TUFC12733]
MIPFATTQRLILRAWRDSDKDSIFTALNDPRVAHGISGELVPQSDTGWERLKIDLDKTFMVLVIEIKKEYLYMRGHDPNEIEDELEPEVERREKRKFVGMVTLDQTQAKNRNTELGIFLAFAWWSKGLGTEVLQWLLKYNFETLGMHRMTLHAYGDNMNAIELYKHLGYVEEGRMREAVTHEGAWIDVVIMSMLDREWQAAKTRPIDLSKFEDVVVSTIFRLG